MRWVATFFTLIACAATGLAAKELHAALSQPMPTIGPEDLSRPREAVVEVVAAAPMVWPALFGTPAAQEAVLFEAPAADPVVQEVPVRQQLSLSSLGYKLKGLVQNGDVTWALVAFPDGEQILKVGDVLGSDMIVEGIDDTGLWIDTGGDTPELLAFSD